jgi:hypothetical protein
MNIAGLPAFVSQTRIRNRLFGLREIQKNRDDLNSFQTAIMGR